jgi:hypothetical protein
MLGAWTVSLAIRRKKGQELSFEEIAAFVFTILGGLAFLRTSGAFRYIFVPQFVALIFLPASMASIGSLAEQVGLKRFSTALLAGLAAFGLYQLCFDSWVADFYSSRKTAFWQEHFLPENAPATPFFYNVPEVALFARGERYYQYLEPAPGLEVGARTLAAIEQGLPDEIIIQTAEFESLGHAGQQKFAAYASTSEAYKYTILKKK